LRRTSFRGILSKGVFYYSARSVYPNFACFYVCSPCQGNFSEEACFANLGSPQFWKIMVRSFRRACAMYSGIVDPTEYCKGTAISLRPQHAPSALFRFFCPSLLEAMPWINTSLIQPRLEHDFELASGLRNWGAVPVLWV
jgi:hypothetical protein